MELTVPALIVNVDDVTPAETVTDAGTDATLELEESKTPIAPAGAAAVRVTVPVTVPPLTMEVVDKVTLCTVVVVFALGVTVRLACADVPP
jgi:hypothetical protein